MSDEINVEDEDTYTTCEINGTQFILQTITSPEDNAKFDSSNENQVILNEPNHVPSITEDDSISVICLDGQMYAFRNGVLEELELSQLIDQNECQEENILLSKDEISEEEQYIPDVNELITATNVEEKNDFIIDMSQNNRNFIVAKENVNANDYVEIVTAFKCKICPYTTQDREELLAHFRNTHICPTANVEMEPVVPKPAEEVKLVYMCGECSNCFPSMKDCREHMIKDHQLVDCDSSRSNESQNEDMHDSEFINPTNEYAEKDESKQVKMPRTPNSEYMFNKKTIDVIEKTIKCSYRGCIHKFSTEETMQQHLLCHMEPQGALTFRCSICREEKFSKWRPCSLHLWKQHQIDLDLFTCKICKVYKSATMVKLLTHMRVHSEKRDYKCEECGKCFKQSNQLRNHRVMHLDRKASELPRWYTSKTCEMCGKMYADSKCLKIHIQSVHSKLKPYVCNVCGHSSAKKAMLQMHLRQHTGDKPFTCEICDYKTGDHNSLRRHMMRHTGVRPYKCPHCPYSAIQSSSYKNHLKSKHPHLSGLFTCDLCPFKTVKEESYIQHIADHDNGLIKSNKSRKDNEDVEVFPGNIAAAQLIYSCLGAFSKSGENLEANLMSSSTSADGTSQTITIQIPSKHLEDSLPSTQNTCTNSSIIEQEDDETMHCFLKIPREEEENIDTGGITIPAEPEDSTPLLLNDGDP